MFRIIFFENVDLGYLRIKNHQTSLYICIVIDVHAVRNPYTLSLFSVYFCLVAFLQTSSRYQLGMAKIWRSKLQSVTDVGEQWKNFENRWSFAYGTIYLRTLPHHCLCYTFSLCNNNCTYSAAPTLVLPFKCFSPLWSL